VTREVGVLETTKYSLTNASNKIPLPKLPYMQRQRYWIERAFQEAKNEAGMDEYQARSWQAWYHHMALVMMALLFTEKREKSSRILRFDPVILLGDPDQLKPIGPGDAYRGLLEQHAPARLETIRRRTVSVRTERLRRTEPWQREASENLAGGRVAPALDAYRQAGRLHPRRGPGRAAQAVRGRSHRRPRTRPARARLPQRRRGAPQRRHPGPAPGRRRAPRPGLRPEASLEKADIEAFAITHSENLKETHRCRIMGFL